MKHTPGPWIAMPDPDSIAGDDFVIGREGNRPDEVAVCSERDARLIAAAPELLEAVYRILTFGARSDTLAFAHKAYAKAIGFDA